VIFSHDESISERASRSQDDYTRFILNLVSADAASHLKNELENAAMTRYDELGSAKCDPSTGDFAHVCSMSKDMSGCASTVYVVTSNLASGSAEPSALSVVVDIKAHIVKRMRT
jgi:hypothetical protein